MGLNFDEIADRASTLPEPLFLEGSRLVVHIQTSESAINDFLAVVRELAEEKKKAGFAKPAPQQNGVYEDVYVRRSTKGSNNRISLYAPDGNIR